MERDKLTRNQICRRPGWTGKMVDIAFPKPDGELGKEYNFANLYKLSRVKRAEKHRLAAIAEKVKEQERQELKSLHEAHERAELRSQEAKRIELEKMNQLPSPTPATLERVRSIIDSADITKITQAYEGSDAKESKHVYRMLEKSNDAGPLAAFLLRAQKTSSRAKVYRGESKGRSYAKKEYALVRVCNILSRQKCIRWGWGEDDTRIPEDVLYVDLPNGQISFHCLRRMEGPDYPDEWDGEVASKARIIRFAAAVLAAGRPCETSGPPSDPS